MRITLFYPRVVVAGGAERLLVEELEGLIAAGFEVRVVCFELSDGALFGKRGISDRFDVLSVRGRLSEVLGLRRYLARKPPDLVIAHTHIAASYIYLAVMGMRLPYITHIHGSLFWLDGDHLKYALLHRRAFNRVRRSVLGHQEFVAERWNAPLPMRLVNEFVALVDLLAVRRSASVITLTEHLRWELQQLYGVDAEVVRGCLTADQLERRDHLTEKARLGYAGKQVVLSVGRLDARKRIEVIVRAFASLAWEYPDATLVIGGTGPELSSLNALVMQLSVADRVVFAGFIPDEELPSYYAASDVFVFPSWTSTGITPYESLAQGCPVVWTSEATEPVLNWDSVRVCDPLPQAVRDATAELLRSSTRESRSLEPYSWAAFNRAIEGVISKSIRAK